MTWKEKLVSRKFWVAVAPMVTYLVSQFFGYQVDQSAIIGIGAVIGTYVIGQGFVDATTNKASIMAAADVNKLQLMSLVASLEGKLASIGETSPRLADSVVPIRPEITE